MRGHYKGAVACLSALHRAGRFAELLGVVERDPGLLWHYRVWGVRALVGMGRKADAIQFAEASRGKWTNDHEVDRACEDVLLSSGLVDEAYRRYGMRAARGGTFLATFRAARAAGREDSVRAEVRALVEADASGFLAKVIGREVGLT